MNFSINRLDNIKIDKKDYNIISEDIAQKINMNGAIVGADSEWLIDEKDVMYILKNSELRSLMGEFMYQALIRKPIMLFLMPTLETEFEGTKVEFDRQYGSKMIHLNNFAQSFSIACWFIKDSCVSSVYTYWLNMLNGYYSQAVRHADTMLSDGTVKEIAFTDDEITEAVARMYQVYRYLLPDESRAGSAEMTISGGTTVWEIDKAISTEGNSFARALILLQEARKTGVISTRIDKYCSILECLYAIRREHKKNISQITAAYIGKDATEMTLIETDMRDAYGVRSDGSHGENLKYLRDNNQEDLVRLSKKTDEYVRRVFRKVIMDDALNYDTTEDRKTVVRAYFRRVAEAVSGLEAKQQQAI